MRTVLRIAVGFALFAGGLTCLVYGIAQAIENGSCGSDSYGNSFGPACPSGFGPMIVLMVLGTFAAIAGAGRAAPGRGAVAMVGGTIRLLGALFVAAIAGVVFGIVDLHADDTRPGLEIVVAVVVPVLLVALPGVGKKARATAPGAPAMTPPVTFAAPPPAATRATNANAEEIATRLRQLDQLRDSGLLDDAAYKERRKQILAEL